MYLFFKIQHIWWQNEALLALSVRSTSLCSIYSNSIHFGSLDIILQPSKKWLWFQLSPVVSEWRFLKSLQLLYIKWCRKLALTFRSGELKNTQKNNSKKSGWSSDFWLPALIPISDVQVSRHPPKSWGFPCRFVLQCLSLSLPNHSWSHDIADKLLYWM